MHIVREADPQPVITPNKKKNMECLPSYSHQAQISALPPLILVNLAPHGNAVMFITSEAVSM